MIAVLLLAVAAEFAQHCYNLADVRYQSGVISAEISASDPIMQSAVAPFAADCRTGLKVKVWGERCGRWQIYWKSDSIDRFGGGRCEFFDVINTNEWTELEVRPIWNGEGRITELRLDPPDFSSGRIKVAEFEPTALSGALTPFDTDEKTTVVFDAISDKIAYGAIRWHSMLSTNEWTRKYITFTTAADDTKHTYWFDMRSGDLGNQQYAGANSWRGTNDYFEIRRVLDQMDFPAENIRLIKGRPNLGADPGIVSAMSEEAIPRAGRRFPLEIVVRNFGTEAAKNLEFSFEGLPAGFRTIDSRELSPTGTVAASEGRDSCGSGRDLVQYVMKNERRFRITFAPPPAGNYHFTLCLKADGVATRRIAVKGKILPSLDLPKAEAMPAVTAVSTEPYRIGATIFPQWRSHHYHAIWSRAPWRKSTLGWYDPGAQEVVDWQIKYLAENGVSWVLVCWYYQGANDWIDAFRKSRYRNNLKWCLQWGIYGGLAANNEAKMRAVARFWVENYFGAEEYMKIDGKPVVNIFNAHQISSDRTKVKALFDALKDEVVKAGFPGLYLCGQRDQNVTPERFEHLAELGIVRTTVYKFLYDVYPERTAGFVDYHDIALASPAHWRTVMSNSPIPSFPSLSTGYDPRPWLGEVSPETVENINAADFKLICEEAKAFSDETGERYLLVGPLDEWGEGSIGFPNRELGFGMLNAIRETFGVKPAGGWPVNCCPEDVGLKVTQMYAIDDPPGEAAEEGVIKVSNAAELRAAITGVETGDLIILTDDIDYTGDIDWSRRPSFTLDLNGYDLTVGGTFYLGTVGTPDTNAKTLIVPAGSTLTTGAFRLVGEGDELVLGGRIASTGDLYIGKDGLAQRIWLNAGADAISAVSAKVINAGVEVIAEVANAAELTAAVGAMKGIKIRLIDDIAIAGGVNWGNEPVFELDLNGYDLTVGGDFFVGINGGPASSPKRLIVPFGSALTVGKGFRFIGKDSEMVLGGRIDCGADAYVGKVNATAPDVITNYPQTLTFDFTASNIGEPMMTAVTALQITGAVEVGYAGTGGEVPFSVVRDEISGAYRLNFDLVKGSRLIFR